MTTTKAEPHSAPYTVYEVGRGGHVVRRERTLGLAMKFVHGRGPGYRVWKVKTWLGFGRHGEQHREATLMWPRGEAA